MAGGLGLTVVWDAKQYARFGDARSRPFFDLLGQVKHHGPRQVVDLGCGTGQLTAALAERWQEAYILGIDSSREMLEATRDHAIPGRLEFQRANIATWLPIQPCDVMVSNAALQWVPNHLQVLGKLSAYLTPGGVIAFQVPGNFESASHRAIYEVCSQSEWEQIRDISRPAVHAPEAYLEAMSDWGYVVDVWETTYIHCLQGENPVLEWVKGTALRPALARLDPERQDEFLSQVGQRLREAYPAGRHGTLLPFRRIFVVAARS
jgi:trans-aconitate 2-methyltransferase